MAPTTCNNSGSRPGRGAAWLLHGAEGTHANTVGGGGAALTPPPPCLLLQLCPCSARPAAARLLAGDLAQSLRQLWPGEVVGGHRHLRQSKLMEAGLGAGPTLASATSSPPWTTPLLPLVRMAAKHLGQRPGDARGSCAPPPLAPSLLTVLPPNWPGPPAMTAAATFPMSMVEHQNSCAGQSLRRSSVARPLQHSESHAHGSAHAWQAGSSAGPAPLTPTGTN